MNFNYLQSSISTLSRAISSLRASFSSLQCTLMHFLGGNDDFGVFIPICGLGVGGNSRGAGTVHFRIPFVRPVEGSSSLDSSLAEESRFT